MGDSNGKFNEGDNDFFAKMQMDSTSFKKKFDINNHLIYPNSWKSIIFDVIFAHTLVYWYIAFPIKLALNDVGSKSSKIWGMDIACQVIWLLNIIRSFFTTHYDKDQKMVKDINIIAKRYLLGFFIFDLISLMPYYLGYYHLDRKNMYWFTIFCYFRIFYVGSVFNYFYSRV